MCCLFCIKEFPAKVADKGMFLLKGGDALHDNDYNIGLTDEEKVELRTMTFEQLKTSLKLADIISKVAPSHHDSQMRSYIGVRRRKGSNYQAQLGTNGYIGSFPDPETAAYAYDEHVLEAVKNGDTRMIECGILILNFPEQVDEATRRKLGQEHDLQYLVSSDNTKDPKVVIKLDATPCQQQSRVYDTPTTCHAKQRSPPRPCSKNIHVSPRRNEVSHSTHRQRPRQANDVGRSESMGPRQSSNRTRILKKVCHVVQFPIFAILGDLFMLTTVLKNPHIRICMFNLID